MTFFTPASTSLAGRTPRTVAVAEGVVSREVAEFGFAVFGVAVMTEAAIV